MREIKEIDLNTKVVSFNDDTTLTIKLIFDNNGNLTEDYHAGVIAFASDNDKDWTHWKIKPIYKHQLH